MVEDKKQALKKFFRNYTLVVLVIVGLIITLLLLVWFRFLALVSIGDLSKINPLITSGQNRLVLKDGTSEIVKIPIDGTAANKGSSDSNTPADTSTGGASSENQSNSATTTTGGTVQTSNGGASTPVVTVSPSVSPSSSPSPVPTTAAFTANIGSNVTYETSNKSSYANGCTITYKFTFTATAQNAPGVAKAQWRWPGSTWGNEFNVSFSVGQTSVPVTIQQYVSANTSDQVVSLRLNSPNAVEKDYGFKHQC
ncbi:MAG: hypothetical protein JWO07_21 [Candidatus Saccharibacteria bacterium]|nr:hypothetical protein [Candidatus Saccharibacteria bacterium]